MNDLIGTRVSSSELPANSALVVDHLLQNASSAVCNGRYSCPALPLTRNRNSANCYGNPRKVLVARTVVLVSLFPEFIWKVRSPDPPHVLVLNWVNVTRASLAKVKRVNAPGAWSAWVFPTNVLTQKSERLSIVTPPAKAADEENPIMDTIANPNIFFIYFPKDINNITL